MEFRIIYDDKNKKWILTPNSENTLPHPLVFTDQDLGKEAGLYGAISYGIHRAFGNAATFRIETSFDEPLILKLDGNPVRKNGG
jgi:hypothetical protein